MLSDEKYQRSAYPIGTFTDQMTYPSKSNSQVEIYDDRVVISNPGGLLLAVKKESGTKSMSRNPLIFGLFTRMSLVKQVASGIARMRDEMKEVGLPEPAFTTDEGFFTVEFRHPDDSGTVNGTANDTVKSKATNEEVVFELIKSKEELSPKSENILEKAFGQRSVI